MSKERERITSADVGTITASDIIGLPPEHEADFEGHKPLPGAEHLGRAIVDKNGFPSGSPANYEVLRIGAVAEQAEIARLEAGPTPSDVAAALASVTAATQPSEE